MKNLAKVGAAVSTAVVTLWVLTGVAFATPPTAESIVTASATSLKDELLDIAAAVAPFAAALVAVMIGWRFARRVVKL